MKTKEFREIRKYANRRLYDMQESRYINRDDLRTLIADGESVRVVDETSGDDITRSLLLQLLAEQELGGQPVLSDRMLTELIRYYEHPMQAVLGQYLQQTMELFIEQRQGFQGQAQKVLDALPGSDLAKDNLQRFMDWQKSVLDPMSSTQGRRRGGGRKKPES
ncbi:MAG: polyhydroxyalkanoate synthesis repressor PhaR [Pseudomonadota bacterium]